MNETLKRTSQITFGKHRGKSVRWVLSNDTSYLLWLIKEAGMKFEADVLKGIYSRSWDKPQLVSNYHSILQKIKSDYNLA